VVGDVTPRDALASPLAEIEQRVLGRARQEALDLDAAATEGRIRALVADEVERWQRDHQLGTRDFALPDPALAVERVERNLLGYGPLGPLLDDDDVWEVMVNAPDEIFVKRHAGISGYHDEAFHDDAHVERILTKLLDRASTSHRTLDAAAGLQDGQLDDGARLHIVHRDIGRGGHLLVNVRKFTGVAFRTLDELVARGMLPSVVRGFLHAAASVPVSTLVAGPPGSGKTTLLSCLAAELDPALRVVTAEEVFEVDVPLPNVASMQTRPARPDRAAVDLRRLVAGFLRMAPDVAIVGEVRDREALPLLLTLSSGVTGLATIHAGSARQALSRLRLLCQLADTSSELPLPALTTLVAEAVDLVVHCARVGGTPRVTQVVAVEAPPEAGRAAEFATTVLFDRADGALRWTGHVPVRLAARFAAAGTDLAAILAAVPADEAPVARAGFATLGAGQPDR